jgi:hypothetical protein
MVFRTNTVATTPHLLPTSSFHNGSCHRYHNRIIQITSNIANTFGTTVSANMQQSATIDVKRLLPVKVLFSETHRILCLSNIHVTMMEYNSTAEKV